MARLSSNKKERTKSPEFSDMEFRFRGSKSFLFTAEATSEWRRATEKFFEGDTRFSMVWTEHGIEIHTARER